MTEKRFEVFDDNGYLFIKDNQGKFKPHELCNVYQYCKYINQLSEENEQLKQQIKELQEFKDNYDKNMELIHNSEYVQDFLHGNL